MKHRGLVPSQWDSLSKLDKEEMMADYLTDQEMAGWEDYRAGQEIKKQQAKQGKGLKRK